MKHVHRSCNPQCTATSGPDHFLLAATRADGGESLRLVEPLLQPESSKSRSLRFLPAASDRNCMSSMAATSGGIWDSVRFGPHQPIPARAPTANALLPADGREQQVSQLRTGVRRRSPGAERLQDRFLRRPRRVRPGRSRTRTHFRAEPGCDDRRRRTRAGRGNECPGFQSDRRRRRGMGHRRRAVASRPPARSFRQFAADHSAAFS
jgi:hypothetical protein